jgi:phosphotriesterase-related protein
MRESKNMKSINTVLGRISQPEYHGLNIYIADAWLKRLRNAGCRSLAEVTPILPHRFSALNEKMGITTALNDIKELSKKCDINVVCSTGYYIPELVSNLKNLDAETISNTLIQTIEEGFGDTGVHPAIIKVGSHHLPLTPLEEKVFLAAGIAQSQTGVAVCCHSIYGPRNQLAILMKGDADINHCYFSHVEAEFGWEGRSLQQEAEYLLDVARKGGSLLFNNFGFEHDTPWEDLVYLIKYLVEKGYASKVLVSMDANWRIQRNGRALLADETKNPECGRRDYAYLFTHSIPEMLEAGITRENINTFLVENPKAILQPSN